MVELLFPEIAFQIYHLGVITRSQEKISGRILRFLKDDLVETPFRKLIILSDGCFNAFQDQLIGF